MKPADFAKHKDIIQFITQKNEVSVRELAERFYLSEATVRRTLTKLENVGYVVRFHGGARLADPMETSRVKRRSLLHVAEKDAIAAFAAGLVQDGATILMMGGSSVAAMCPHLQGKNITIITNSIVIIQEMAWMTNCKVILLAGVLNPTEMEVRGALTEHSMARLHAGLAFFGTSGLSLQHGVLTDDPNAIGTYEKCVSISEKTYVLADHTKFTNPAGTTAVFNLDERINLITDDKAPPAVIKALKARGVSVDVVGNSEPASGEAHS